jgi:hypothetical protein
MVMTEAPFRLHRLSGGEPMMAKTKPYWPSVTGPLGQIATVALWLGHQNVATMQIYVHADLVLKEQALARTATKGIPPGRYRPSAKLLEPFPTWLCLAELQYVNGLGELPRAPRTATELAEDPPCLERRGDRQRGAGSPPGKPPHGSSATGSRSSGAAGIRGNRARRCIC